MLRLVSIHSSCACKALHGGHDPARAAIRHDQLDLTNYCGPMPAAQRESVSPRKYVPSAMLVDSTCHGQGRTFPKEQKRGKGAGGRQKEVRMTTATGCLQMIGLGCTEIVA